MTHDDFLRAILAARRDDLPRLMYADWLEERGDPRAQFLRLPSEQIKWGNIWSGSNPFRTVGPFVLVRPISSASTHIVEVVTPETNGQRLVLKLPRADDSAVKLQLERMV